MPQRTFDLIPTTLVSTNGPTRAMTSKAAKKAYAKRNQGPKISKAEQRRLEKEELDKQKREYERERAAARAKIAREKKAEKTEAVRQERKRKGLPEPNKFVRPSQPTISMFVRRDNKRSWETMDVLPEEESDATICDDEIDDPQKKRAKVTSDHDTEDEFGEFPSFSQSDFPEILAKLDSSSIPTGMSQAVDEKFEDHESGSPELPTKISVSLDQDQYSQDEDFLADMATTQLLSESADAAMRENFDSSTVPIIDTLISQVDIPRTINQPTKVVAANNHSNPKLSNTAPSALKERSVNLGPRVAPMSKAAKSITFAPSPFKDRITPSMVHKAMLPPSATQAFLENHLDDFFPSPSQEVRELLEDIDDYDLPSNTQIAKELSPIRAEEEDMFGNMFCTQDLVLSSQDLLEIITPSRPPAKVTSKKDCPPPPPLPLPQVKQRRRFFEEKEEDLIHAAIQESIHDTRLLAHWEESVETTVEAPLKQQRTFMRVASTSAMTDYGEDEINDEELLAFMC